MSNSPLVSYTRISPNKNNGRNGEEISRITVHYVDGKCSIETLGEIFANPARRASSNYGIGPDGRVGMYVEECDRSWCSSSGYNDRKAITIECANLTDGSLTEATWTSLVALCADVCRRNGIVRMNYTGDDNGNLTMHRWYADTDCPGPWLSKQFGRLADEVNAELAGANADKPTGTLVIDGIGGYFTVMDLQRCLGAPVLDGWISSQYGGNRQYVSALRNVEYVVPCRGSATVRLLQRRIGMSEEEADGLWGKQTSTRLQEYLEERGYGVGRYGCDGYFGADSMRALQMCLNDDNL